MRAFPVLCVCFALAGVQEARAASYVVTFQSGKMRPRGKGEGVRGARQITASWTIPSLPKPGNCNFYEDSLYITAYSDGRNTLQSLLTEYQYKPNFPSSLKLCLKHDSEISQDSSMVMDLVTNTQGTKHSEYTSSYVVGIDPKFISMVSIQTFGHRGSKRYQENLGGRGVFTLTGAE